MRPDFWAGKRVFLTGHTGFKGAWCALWLQKLRAEVIGYSLEAPTSPSLFALASVADGMESLHGDIREYEALRKAISRVQPDIVLHMAAQSLVRYSYDRPLETYTTNVIGTANILEAVRYAGSVRVVLNITSDKCYENKEWLWGYRENDALGGRDPYSSSKACAELVTAAYRASYFNNSSHVDGRRPAVATARAGNVIGGGDWAADRLIPDMVRAFIRGVPVKIRNPNSTRPWQHVLEPIAAYFLLIEYLWESDESFGDSWNFGPDNDDVRPVNWIVERMIAGWGRDASYTIETGEHPHEAKMLALDCTKAKSVLGWRPGTRLAEALDWTIEWYRAYADKQDMRSFTEKQIGRYESIIV